jgi:hypothetical protein
MTRARATCDHDVDLLAIQTTEARIVGAYHTGKTIPLSDDPVPSPGLLSVSVGAPGLLPATGTLFVVRERDLDGCKRWP